MRGMISLEIPPALEYQARITAATQRISRSELIRRALVDYLAKLEQPAGHEPARIVQGQGANNGR